MSDDPTAYVDPPFRQLCRETQVGLTGEFVFEADQLKLKLISWEGQLFQPTARDICIELEDGHVATLLQCVPQEWNAHFVDCNVNQAVIGHREWTPDDRVRRLTFAFWAAREALHYNDHVEAGIEALDDIGDAVPTLLPSKIERSKLSILNATAGNLRVEVGFDAVVGFDRFRPGPRFRPLVAIEFTEPEELDVAKRLARHVLSFFELSVGVRSRMIDLRIGTQSLEERNSSIAAGAEPDEFMVRVPHTPWGIADRAPPGTAAFPVYNPEQRALTAKMLSDWLERVTDWEPSYALASQYLTMRSQFNRDRLLRLAAWFESLPIGERKSAIAKTHREAITRAAQEQASKLGLDEYHERIREVLDGLAKKPLKAQLCDVAAILRERFPNLVPEEIAADLQRFAKLRNDAAHGRIALSDDDGARNIRAMRAVELVCFLSMLTDMPVTTATANNLVRHVLAHYALWR